MKAETMGISDGTWFAVLEGQPLTRDGKRWNCDRDTGSPSGGRCTQPGAGAGTASFTAGK